MFLVEDLDEGLGRDANYLWTAFGPTNVDIHRVASAGELGDVQVAIDLGPRVDTSPLPMERRVRHALKSPAHTACGTASTTPWPPCSTPNGSHPNRSDTTTSASSSPSPGCDAAGALFRDAAGRVLLVKPTYRRGWDIPGGYVTPGESPLAACRRELAEELARSWPVQPQPLPPFARRTRASQSHATQRMYGVGHTLAWVC